MICIYSTTATIRDLHSKYQLMSINSPLYSRDWLHGLSEDDLELK